MFDASRPYSTSSVGPVRTRSRPSTARSSSTSRSFTDRRRYPPIPSTPVPSSADDDLHEWISFPDPNEERTWVIDATFLLSNWTCIYGRGCKGVLEYDSSSLHQGCCSYGAHFF